MDGPLKAYEQDLAYIHDAGFCEPALHAADVLLDALRGRTGLVVDLGCGSGPLAGKLASAGYDVLGVDISPAMIRLARKRAPGARFVAASLHGFELPECCAVTAIGEAVNYCFDPASGPRSLRTLIRRVWKALRPGGVFLFDIAEPGASAGRPPKWQMTADDWAVLSEVEEDAGILLRRVTGFRKVGRLYRRSEETHCLRLYDREDVATALRQTGFTVRRFRGYGRFRLPSAHSVFLARKPVPVQHRRL